MDVPAFRRSLRAWFRRHGRDLPWRRTRDPYAILVSEVMLQQTTVAAVVPYFERWMKRFPNPRDLAAAGEPEVLALWQGLGYYRRARNLRAAAQAIESAGRFPTDYPGLRVLPGVGDYTAQAVRAFACDEPVPVLDANVIRVIARLFDIRAAVDKAGGMARVRAAAESLLPAKGGREFASALMELGALVCRAGCPDCLLCPVKRFCAAKKPEDLPVKAPKKPLVERAERAAWVQRGARVLLQQCAGRRWAGLWRLPPLDDAPPGPAVAEVPYSIVRERVTLRVFKSRRSALPPTVEERREFALDALPAVPSPHRRAIDALCRG